MNTANDYNANRAGGTASVAPTEQGGAGVGTNYSNPSQVSNVANDVNTNAPVQPTPDANAIGPGRTQQMPSSTANPNPPSADHGSIFRSILGVLAGPSYKYTVDPNSGKMVRTPVQRTKSQLAESIVAGALTGMFAGAQSRNPVAAFGAGGNAGMNLAQQKDSASQENAVQNFGRQASIFESNMRLRMNAAQLATMDYGLQTKLAANNTDFLQKAEDAGALVDGGAEFSDDQLPQILQKYHVTKDLAIMTPRVEPIQDEQGNTVGFKHYFKILDPTAQMQIPEDDKATAKEIGLPVLSSDKLPKDARARVMYLARAHHILDMYRINKQLFSNYYDYANKMKGNAGLGTEKTPELKDGSYKDLIDKYADQYGIPKGLAYALINRESGGSQDAKSKAGALGVMQLMPDTAKALGVDPNDPEQNIKGGMQYLKQQLDKYKGKPELALAAYNAGPGAVTDHVPQNGQTEDYVKNIMSQIGGIKEGTPEEERLGVNLAQMFKDDPSGTQKALETLQRFNRPTIQDSIDEMRKPEYKVDPDVIGKITQMFGGQKLISQVSDEQRLEKQKKQLDLQTQADLDRKRQEAAITEQQNEAFAKKQGELLQMPDSWNPDDPTLEKMSLPELKQKLESAGVKIPDQLASLYNIAHYKEELKGTIPVRVSSKSYQMDANTASAYIRQFINPNFNAQQYDEAKKWRTEFGSDRVGGSGGAVSSSGTAAQHLDLLSQAFEAINNDNVQFINKLKNRFKLETGSGNVALLKAIAHQVGNEVGKVNVGGTQVTMSESQKLEDSLHDGMSPDQQDQVINGYIGLMSGRLSQIDHESMNYRQKHINDKLSPQATIVWQKYGHPTPWQPNLIIPGLPKAPTVDGKYLNDPTSGRTIGVSKGGHWVQPFDFEGGAF